MSATERRKQYKKNIVYVMGDGCAICGYNKSTRALECHHIIPEDKSFGISQKTYYAWSKLENELKKCILVCSNCHCEIEDGLLEVTNLTSSFNQERFNEIAQQIQDKKDKKKCIECGAEITSKATRCIICDQKHRQVTSRPDREKFKELVWNNSFSELGRRFQVSDNAIKKWCDFYHLPRKRSEIKNFTYQEWKQL